MGLVRVAAGRDQSCAVGQLLAWPKHRIGPWKISHPGTFRSDIADRPPAVGAVGLSAIDRYLWFAALKSAQANDVGSDVFEGRVTARQGRARDASPVQEGPAGTLAASLLESSRRVSRNSSAGGDCKGCWRLVGKARRQRRKETAIACGVKGP